MIYFAIYLTVAILLLAVTFIGAGFVDDAQVADDWIDNMIPASIAWPFAFVALAILVMVGLPIFGLLMLGRWLRKRLGKNARAEMGGP